MPTSTPTSATSAAAAPISRCARRFTLPRAREEGGSHELYAENESPRLCGECCSRGGRIGARLPPPVWSRRSAHAAAVSEVNAWVVVQPDETVIIRIARSEMGQGTLTGLAQLAAEELEC